MPRSLLKVQTWLASRIVQPLQSDEKLPSPDGCSTWVKPSATLLPYQRVELYHRQYWWRLIDCLQSNFPMVTRLFGYSDFKREIAIPYLHESPPTHWALCQLGESLPKWIGERYQNEDVKLVKTCAEIDWALGKAFWVKEFPSVNFSALEEEEILTSTFYLQPHVQLFSLKADLFSFRETFLSEEVDYWNTHPFPPLNHGEKFFAVYRFQNKSIKWKEISKYEFKFLSFFIKGLTLNQACDKIEQEGGEFYAQAQLEMPLWLRDWTILGWLTKETL